MYVTEPENCPFAKHVWHLRTHLCPADEYFLSRLPIVETRLAQGGVRLAAILNRLFSAKSNSQRLAFLWSCPVDFPRLAFVLICKDMNKSSLTWSPRKWSILYPRFKDGDIAKTCRNRTQLSVLKRKNCNYENKECPSRAAIITYRTFLRLEDAQESWPFFCTLNSIFENWL
jgi:hypothetical protein